MQQADVDLGSITNTAEVTGLDPNDAPVTDEDTEIVEGTPDPSIDLDKTASPGPFELNSTIDYEFLVTNTGNQTLDAVVVTDPLVTPILCPAASLLPGASMVCTGSYVVDQDDVDAGTVPNTATVTGLDPTSTPQTDEDTEVTPVVQVPSISLDKQAPAGTLEAGQIITYPFVVTNTGTVTLTNVRVDDPRANPVSCDLDVLVPSEVTDCTATYVITQADVNAGEIPNTATATGDTPSGSTADEDTVITPLAQNPAILLVKTGPSAVATVGQTIQYSFVVTNTGDVTLNPVSVDDPLANPVTCSRTSLDPAVSTTCTASYVVTQADADAGEIVNVATASGLDPNGETVTDDDSVVTPTAQTPAILLDKDAPVGNLVAGAQISYTFEVTNIGTVTLDDVRVTDPLIPAILCNAATLAPGASTRCTGEYTVTQVDVDAGEIVNVATVIGVDPDGDPVTDDDSETTAFELAPGLTLVKQQPVGDLVAGATLDWTFIVTNTGDVTLTNVTVTDPTTGPVTCDDAVLAPGEDTLCRSTSTVTQADVDNGEITNVATASGSSPDGEELTVSDRVDVDIPGSPSISIVKSTQATLVGLNDEVLFTLQVTNTGNVTLRNVTVTDPLAPVSCPELVLNVGDSMMCTAVMTVTQAMVDAGSISNTATGSGLSPTGETTDNSDTAILTTDPVASIALTKIAPSQASRTGDTIEYQFVVRNTGEVRLTDIVVDDPLTGPVVCPSTVLEVGSDMTCAASYVVTAGDASVGKITNVATVTGTGPNGERPNSTDSVESPVVRPVSPPTGPEAPEYPGPFSPTPVPVVAPRLPVQPPLAQTGSFITPAIATAMTLFTVGGAAAISVRRRRKEHALDNFPTWLD